MEVEVNVPEEVIKVYRVPGNIQLDFQREGNVIKVKVPTFTMHTAVVLGY